MSKADGECFCDDIKTCQCKNNPSVPFDAKIFFSEFGNWEIVCKPGCDKKHHATIELETGLLSYADSWQGMRKKQKQITMWVNIYKNGSVSHFTASAARASSGLACIARKKITVVEGEFDD